MKRKALLLGLWLGLAGPASARVGVQAGASVGVDAPELAAPGEFGIGFRSLTMRHKAQPELENPDAVSGAILLRDRLLRVDVWYPAQVSKRDKFITYKGALWGEPPLPPVGFVQRGLATRNAPPMGTGHPLVILSHGYSNAPAMMSWLTENLASKGYVVAAIHHADPNPYVRGAATGAAPNFNRPMDISFVARQLRSDLGNLIDPQKLALIGFSQGGYGVLTAGGASLDPNHPNIGLVAGGWLKTIARGSSGASTVKVPGVKAIIALAPAGGGETNVWGAEGLAEIKAPLLLIAGDRDPVVGYERAAKAFFALAVNSDRYLLTYKQAGHAIAHNPAPVGMRGSVWDMDWFEDPIWRQDRINGINLHFITAFLAVHLRGDADKRSFIDLSVVDSDVGEWNAPQGTPWGAYSPGGPGVTLWKGFQRRHARGMTLQRQAAAVPETDQR